MCRFWMAVAMALWVGAGCGDSASDIKSNAPETAGAQGSVLDSAALAAPASEAVLYARAQAAEQQGRPQEAIYLYRRILSDFPSSPDNYKAVFLIGFVFSEKLNQPDSARLQFDAVIRDYPDCEFVDDAQAMLRFLKGELPPFEEAPHS